MIISSKKRNGKARGAKAKIVFGIPRKCGFLFCTKNPCIIGIFFNVFVVVHYLLAQLNQVEIPAVETFSYTCSKGGLYKQCKKKKKFNCFFLVYFP